MAPRSWELDFGSRKPAGTYLLENKAFFRWKYEICDQSEPFIQRMMRDSRDSHRFFCRADLLGSFCGNLNIETLLSSTTGLAVQPIALLDDRKADPVDKNNRAGHCRTQKGPLSPARLHLELKKPRYTTTDPGTPNTSTAIDNDVSTTEVDAERRLIYITDLNRYTIYVLLDTASRQQAYTLRDFIYNHLVFTPNIGVTIIPTHFKSFAFAFHFPYYAWRKSPQYFQDERCMSDGRPLRRSQRLGFLDENIWGVRCIEAEDCIYQAQISCLIAGLDEYSYVGYAFVDTYHNGPNSNETVREYHEKSNTPGHYHMDPLSGGLLHANLPMWNPRLYFLRVFELRIEQVKEEWVYSVFMLQKKASAYIQDYQVSKDLYLSPDVDGRGERLRRFHNWTESTARLVMDLIHILSKTLHACDKFRRQDCECFRDDNGFPSDHPPPSQYLSAIARHVDEMKDQLQTLHHLDKLCNSISRELEAYLSLEDRDVTMYQVRTNESVKAVTFLAFLVSPPAVTSALYSMQDAVLPWEVDTRSWGITLGFFYLVLGLVQWFLLRRSDRKLDRALRGQTRTWELPTRTKAHCNPWSKQLQAPGSQV